MKNGFTPREVARFLPAEKPARFRSPRDVLDGRATLMKCLEYSQNPARYIYFRCVWDLTF